VRGKYGQFLGDDIFLSLHPFELRAVRENLRHLRRRRERNDDGIRKEMKHLLVNNKLFQGGKEL